MNKNLRICALSLSLLASTALVLPEAAWGMQNNQANQDIVNGNNNPLGGQQNPAVVQAQQQLLQVQQQLLEESRVLRQWYIWQPQQLGERLTQLHPHQQPLQPLQFQQLHLQNHYQHQSQQLQEWIAEQQIASLGLEEVPLLQGLYAQLPQQLTDVYTQELEFLNRLHQQQCAQFQSSVNVRADVLRTVKGTILGFLSTLNDNVYKPDQSKKGKDYRNWLKGIVKSPEDGRGLIQLIRRPDKNADLTFFQTFLQDRAPLIINLQAGLDTRIFGVELALPYSLGLGPDNFRGLFCSFIYPPGLNTNNYPVTFNSTDFRKIQQHSEQNCH